MNHVVPKQWLLARMYEPDLVIADCRFQLGDPAAGRRAYEESRIPGAVYFDLEKDLSGPVASRGGRHPLPDPDELAHILSKAGIDHTVRVVAYDDQGGAMASRLWWLLRYMGHSRVYVMDEGFDAWKKARFPVTSASPPIRVPKRFVPEVRQDMLADVEQVRRVVQEGSAVLLDSREPRRYQGLEEPIDPVAGHIPGARNAFWKDNLKQNESGTMEWKKVTELQNRFTAMGLDPDQPIIVYCGSGVTACPNILALSEAGYEHVKLYAGSWSNWISYPDNPIATGEE